MIDEFLKELEKFFSYCDQEHTTFARRIIGLYLDKHLYRENPRPLPIVLEETLEFLTGIFPDKVEYLKTMEEICLKAKNIEAT